MKQIAKWTALASLIACLASAALVFAGSLDVASFKKLFLGATAVWFVAASRAFSD